MQLTFYFFRRPKSEWLVSPTSSTKTLDIMHTLINFNVLMHQYIMMGCSNMSYGLKKSKFHDKILKTTFYGLLRPINT